MAAEQQPAPAVLRTLVIWGESGIEVGSVGGVAVCRDGSIAVTDFDTHVVLRVTVPTKSADTAKSSRPRAMASSASAAPCQGSTTRSMPGALAASRACSGPTTITAG